MKILNLYKFIALLTLIILSGYNQHLFAFGAEKRINLKVLYVGYSPEKPMPEKLVYFLPSGKGYEEIYKKRMADFKMFLESNFTKVGTVDARDYTSSLSEQYDVTIIDAGPVNLPANFDRATILIAEMAPNVGLSIGLKFDWYCQCLDNEALNIKTGHEIFNTPRKVNLTLVNQSTPGSFFNGFQGLHTPKEMPRWKVVTQGYSSGKEYLVGMVSHGEGFNDSPDAEVISGGVCLKNADAVALGRQGNYFMWGFAGSPDYMTDEAKNVFVNTICYIKKYDRKPPIVKKIQIETREGIDEKIYRIDEDLYKKAIASRTEGNQRMLKMQQDLKDKKARGETIGYNNEMFLKMPVSNQTQSFEDYLKDYAGTELYAEFGTNITLYHQYFRENYEYFYPSGVYSLQLDSDAKKLGVSNRKIEILEKCIELLEKKEDEALAQRVLERYTKEKFTTASEWRNWLTQNKTKLFYTESGGFKFMVNTYSNLSVLPTKTAQSNKEKPEPTPMDPVMLSANLIPDKNKAMVDLTINADILKGWHIYAYVGKESPFIQTETILELPAGAVIQKDWQASAATPCPGNEGIFLFEDKASFRITVNCAAVKPGAVIKCGLYYQTCNDTKCLQPTRKTIELQIL